MHDELKTLVMQTEDGTVFLVHARGHRQIDFEKAARIFDLTKKKYVRMLQDQQLYDMFGARYGLVNPFSIAKQYGNRIPQIFDPETTESHWSPENTMMTNAGEHTRGIEFRVNETIQLLNGIVKSIIQK